MRPLVVPLRENVSVASDSSTRPATQHKSSKQFPCVTDSNHDSQSESEDDYIEVVTTVYPSQQNTQLQPEGLAVTCGDLSDCNNLQEPNATSHESNADNVHEDVVSVHKVNTSGESLHVPDQSSAESPEEPIRRSERNRRVPDRYGPYLSHQPPSIPEWKEKANFLVSLAVVFPEVQNFALIAAVNLVSVIP